MPVEYPKSSRFFEFDRKFEDRYPQKETNDEINSKTFLVLKKNLSTGEIFLEKIPLIYQYEYLIEQLKVMYQNPNRQIEDLEVFINSGPLSVLLKNYRFCCYLSSTYEGLESWEYDTFAKLKRIDIDKLKLQILNETNPANLTNHKVTLENYVKELKNYLLDRIEWGKIAYMLEIEYERCSKNPNILAYSSRKDGWYNPSFILGDEFSITYKTNFGYGCSSYFYLNIKYKDIDILPYSDWVNYRYANNYDIVRYTRIYPLQHIGWLYSLTFVTEIFNNSINDPIAFMKEWIVNECREMVSALEIMVNQFDCGIIYNHWFYGVKMTITGYELLDLKGEKISGALNFLDNISKLKEISDETDDFISRIIICNSNIYKQLKIAVDVLEKQIESKLNEINGQQSVVDNLKAQINELDNKFLSIIVDIKGKADEDINNQYNEFKYGLVFIIVKIKMIQDKRLRDQFVDLRIKYKSLINDIKKRTNLDLEIQNDELKIRFKAIVEKIWFILVKELKIQADDLAWKEFREKFSLNYFDTNEEYINETRILNKFTYELSGLENWKRKFDGHIEVISKHYNENNIILVA